jgi:hypothetical protein
VTIDEQLAVGILTMPGEEADTLRVVATLERVKRPGDAIYVHCNGFADADAAERIVDRLTGLGAVASVSSSNLGDVGGRNRLTTMPGFRDHAFAVFLDNDIVVSPTMLDSFRNAAASLGPDPTTGAIASPQYSYRRLRESVPGAFTTIGVSEDVSCEVFDVDRFRRLNDALAKPLRPSISGSNVDWRTAYLSSMPYIARAFRQPNPAWQRSVHESPAFRGHVDAGRPIPVGAVSGGATCVPMRHLGDHRPFDDIFRPYGAGDVSFSIGLLERGLRNYVLPAAAIPHGTHERHDERRTPSARVADEVNRARGRLLLASRHGPSEPRPAVTALRKVIGEQVLQLSRGARPSGRSLWAGLVGGSIAERQLAGGEAPVSWTIGMSPSIAVLAPSRFEGGSATPLVPLTRFLREWRSLGASLDGGSTAIDDRIDEVSRPLVDGRDEVLGWLTPLLVSGVDPLSECFEDTGRPGSAGA